MPDKVIGCVDCLKEFTHTEGAQKFFASKGFTESPKRCPGCRKERKATRGGKGPKGQIHDPDRVMYPTTCSECGDKCEVPFKPSNNRPIRCSTCYENRSQ